MNDRASISQDEAPSRKARAHELFMRALDEEESARASFISSQCSGDEALQREVEALVTASQQAGAFLETPAGSLASLQRAPESDGPHPMIGQKIADFSIESVIASGGMGTVFLANQDRPARKVALKMMRSGLVSRAALRRFEDESRILARLQHPNIAQVYAAGTHDDGSGAAPYFAMEYVTDAQPITRYARQRSPSVRERLALFLDACEAVRHGHQKGVIHRDLKPANILVNGGGVVKIIDFGVARAGDCDVALTTLRTDVGQIIGTLQYMSPEQCEADPSNIDIRSDVYALGVVLYELVCERLPYDVARTAVHEAARTICERSPARPSTVHPKLRGDLETIILKALEKPRERRYQSVADLARDIRHYLNSEPIEARPPSLAYQARMFARRNRGMVIAGTIAFGMLIAGTVVSSMLAIGQSRARQLAEQRGTAAQRQADIANAIVAFLNEDLLGTADPFASTDPNLTVREALDAASKLVDERFGDQPHVEASVRAMLGKTYLNLGRYDEAQPHIEQALSLRKAALGPNDRLTLQSHRQLAWLRYHQHQLDEADALLMGVIEAQMRVLGAGHEDTIDSKQLLGSLRLRQSRMDEAQQLFEETLEARRGMSGDPPLESLDALARLHLARGQWAQAQESYEQVLAESARQMGAEHRYTLYARGNLARTLVKRGLRQQAEPLLMESLAQARRILGDDHPDTLVYLGDLASLCTQFNRFEEAEVYADEALERSRRVHGESHPETIACFGHMALLRSRQRRADEAEHLYTQALELARTNLGEAHERTLMILEGFARLRDAQGRRDEAAHMYENALAVRRQAGGVAHPDTLSAAHNLAFVYGNLGRLAEAEALFRDVVEARRNLHGGDDQATATALTNLGEMVRRQGRLEEAEAVYIEAIEVWRRVPGPRPAFQANALGNLAGVLRQLQRPAEAEPLFREALEIQQATLRANDPSIGITMSLLGDTLAVLNRFEEAEPLMLEAYERIKQAPTTSTQRPVERIVRMYESWGKLDEASAWRDKLQE